MPPLLPIAGTVSPLKSSATLSGSTSALTVPFGDKGYISQALFETLYEDGVQLVTKIKTKMKNRLVSMFDRIMLRKRAVIESVVDQLKNISQIEHSRHRSVANCFVNLLAGLAAYTWREKKPSLNIRVKEQLQLVF
jgi:hypothetical protein